MSETSMKLKVLAAHGEDFEWYPTTEEILAKMNDDLHALFVKNDLGRHCRNFNREKMFDCNSIYNKETMQDEYTYYVHSILDVGAGDGRVFNALRGENNDIEVKRRYGIEIAKGQADDLIAKDVFIIGRDFFKTSLLDKAYSVIFSNPPYSKFVPWVEKLFEEANFGVMYLVLPSRWKEKIKPSCGIELYDTKVVGSFDFLHADRKARAKVNLVRVTHKQKEVEDRYNGEKYGSHIEYGSDDTPDSFERWITNNFGAFSTEKDNYVHSCEYEQERALKLKGYGIGELVDDYGYEMTALLDAFKAFGRMPSRILEAFDMNRKSILEVIRNSIKGLKQRYWKAAFEKLDPIKSRLTRSTRNGLVYRMEEFYTLNFNEENIYSIVVWVINNFNRYTGEQILDVFDKLTNQECIKAYKSNIHGVRDDWHYSRNSDCKGKPEKYKLDYRIVTRCYKSYRYDECVVDDFAVICRSLGFFIPDSCCLDTSDNLKGREQTFYTVTGETAFTARYYKNSNVHLKINKKIMLRFNVEAARLRHLINSHEDIMNEFDVSAVEAFKLWTKPSLHLIGQGDIKLLGFSGGEEDTETKQAA